MRVVEGLGFLIRDADFVENLCALDLLNEHLPLEIPPQIRHRQPFLFQCLLKLRLVLKVVRRLDVFENLSELLIAERKTRLAPSLDQQEFVYGRENQIGREFGDGLLQVRTRRRRIRQFRALAEFSHLTGFEFRLCDDFAIHLDQDLLQDLGVYPCRSGQDAKDDCGDSDSFQHDNSLNINILPELSPSQPTQDPVRRATREGVKTCPPRPSD